MEPWVGYIIFSVLSLLFIGLMVLWRHHCRRERSLFVDRFLTGGRDMRTGIVTASLVSLWLWPGTIMGAIIMGQRFGLSGPYWFAAFSATQILFLTALITTFRAHARNARTLPEYIFHRFGPVAHRVAVVLGLVTCFYVLLWVSFQGVKVLADITGASPDWLGLVVPLSFAVPAIIGGLRGTIVLSYLQALIIGGLTLALALLFYSKVGDLGLYRGLAQQTTVDSCLKLGNGRAVVLAVSLLFANMGLILTDQSYWQRAIAAAPRATGPAFLYGGLIAFAIPLALGTAFGAGWLAFSGDGAPRMAELSQGAALFKFIQSQMGTWGTVAFMIVVTTAMFSTGTAELMAIASLFAVDLVELERKSKTDGRGQMRLMRASMVVVAVVCSGLLFTYPRLSYDGPWVGAQGEGILSLLRIAVINAAVIPFTLAILWRRSSLAGTLWGFVAGAITSATVGVVLGTQRLTPTGLFIADAELALIVSGVSFLSSGIVCLVGGMVFGRMQRRVAVPIVLHDRSSIYTQRLSFWVVFVMVILVMLVSFLSQTDFSVRVLAVWIIGGLIVLFLSTAYVTLMPIKEYFESPEVEDEPGGQGPSCHLNWGKDRNTHDLFAS